jgi:hypothetical protein
MKTGIAVLILTLIATLPWSAQRQDVQHAVGAVMDRAAAARFHSSLVAAPLASTLAGKPAELSSKPSVQAGLPPNHESAAFCDVDFCRDKERCVDCQLEIKVVERKILEVSIHYQGRVRVEKLQWHDCQILSNVLVITNQRKAKRNYGRLDGESRQQIDKTWIPEYLEEMIPGVYIKCLNDCYEEAYVRLR